MPRAWGRRSTPTRRWWRWASPTWRRGLLPGLSHQQQFVAHAGGRGGRLRKTQLTGVVGAIAIALLLVAAPNLLHNLPNTALAAVVIASAIGLFEVNDLRRIYRIQRWEFWLSMACFAGVALLGAIPGIGLAIVIAVIEFLWDGWRPHSAVLGRVDGIKGYHDITRYPHARRIPGLVLFRWDAPLFFANAEFFHKQALEAVATSPTAVRWLVVAAEPVTSVDVTAADMLMELDAALHSAGIELCFAEMKDPVKDKLKRFGLFTRLGEELFFPTIGEAVGTYVRTRKSTGWTGKTAPAERTAATTKRCHKDSKRTKEHKGIEVLAPRSSPLAPSSTSRRTRSRAARRGRAVSPAILPAAVRRRPRPCSPPPGRRCGCPE